MNGSVSLLEKMRRFENLHIVFWLIKDSCWMLELRVLGAFMVVPAVILAIYIMIRTLNDPEFYINAAILCWIIANSYWMMVEFFFDDRGRLLASIPFLAGFVFVGLYYLKIRRMRAS